MDPIVDSSTMPRGQDRRLHSRHAPGRAGTLRSTRRQGWRIGQRQIQDPDPLP